MQFFLSNHKYKKLITAHEEEIKQCQEKIADAERLFQLKLEENNLRFEERIKELSEAKIAMLNALENERRMKEQIKSEHNRMQAIISVMGEGLLVINPEYKIVLMNIAAEKLLGVSSADAVGRDAKDIIFMYKGAEILPHDERPVAVMFKTGTPVVTTLADNLYYETISGRKFPMALVAVPLRGDSGIEAAVVIFRDATEEKKLDESRSSFISIASHQLRTPLTSMRWFAEMLLAGDAGKISEDQKHFVERIYEGTDRMIDLVNLLLQIARVEAGRVKIKPMRTDFKIITKSVALTLQAALDKKMQKVEIQTGADPLPLVLMDQDILWQVVQNLLSNAIRYSPERGVITVSIAEKNGMIEWSVRDEGIGVPKNQQSRVFEKFFRADNALKMVPEGSGLGLSLVKTLVEGWGGKIWFESEENKGTAFHFTAPLDGMKEKEGEVSLGVVRE